MKFDLKEDAVRQLRNSLWLAVGVAIFATVMILFLLCAFTLKAPVKYFLLYLGPVAIWLILKECLQSRNLFFWFGIRSIELKTDGIVFHKKTKSFLIEKSKITMTGVSETLLGKVYGMELCVEGRRVALNGNLFDSADLRQLKAYFLSFSSAKD